MLIVELLCTRAALMGRPSCSLLCSSSSFVDLELTMDTALRRTTNNAFCHNNNNNLSPNYAVHCPFPFCSWMISPSERSMSMYLPTLPKYYTLDCLETKAVSNTNSLGNYETNWRCQTIVQFRPPREASIVSTSLAEIESEPNNNHNIVVIY